jgi:2-polyprenyl-6-methoxyphenol hydroxylase-like FAD-dependent oxidoreductase
VPQSPHPHGLLVGGQRILDEFFSGFVEEMVSYGAPYACFTSARKRYQNNEWASAPESDLWTLFSSRGLLEWAVRCRVLKLSNVELCSERRVLGVVVTARGAVCGVRSRSTLGGPEEAMDADLVVDATGRSSSGPSWLSELGYQPPEEITANAFWGYASRFYQMPEDWDPDWSAIVTIPTGQPGQTRGAVLYRMERGTCVYTLVGCAKDHPTRDEQAFQDWTAALPAPDWAEAIAVATPLTDVAVWLQTFNRLRRYELLSRRPEGLLFVGDTACMLNPVYGQGMTVAALGARELQAVLQERAGTDHDLTGLAEQFQCRLAEAVRFSWVVTSEADHAVPGAVTAPRNAEEFELGRRWRGAMVLSTEDPQVFRLLWEALMLVTPPDWLFHGVIADRIDAG